MAFAREPDILQIIEKLTTTGKKTLEDDLMKQLKTLCKTSNENLLEGDLEEFLELVVETNPDKPLPLPQVDFNDMEARNAVQREKHQQEQERLERILSERVSRIRSEMPEISGEISSILLQMENCFKLLVPHATEELFSCEDFELTNEKQLENNDIKTPNISNQDHDASNSLRHHGINDMKKVITIDFTDTNEDTVPVIDNLNDLQKQLSTRYFPMVINWLKTLTKGSNCIDVLKQTIDLRNLIEAALEKYRDLKIKPDTPNCEEDDEDDEFIEVKEKDGYEAETIKEPFINFDVSEPSCSKELSTVEKAYLWKLGLSKKDDVKDPTTAISTINKRINETKTKITLTSDSSVTSEIKVGDDKKNSNKSKLLEKAPVLPYDIDLYHWEDEKPLVPEIVKFDSLHKFWETKDDDTEENEALKEVQIASLRTRKIDFSGKFEPVKWSCRAPLPSGKLCPRKDRYKCPFHGKIIKRDDAGNPVDPTEVAGPSNASTSATTEERKSQEKEDGLTNIKKIKVNTRDRLTKKIIKRHKHYAKKLDDMERKKFNDKFGDQWNYY
ncbi:UV-stimulated scaffold protein A [Trichonephila inaurata madagascariensis]|uniref:UV-stimulated scaffold protein A n=1 Tax=Trichonephila inaurata madagascariensis TaxID=2747483 RepID=A0A8X6M8D6_9ARAC|nr:UV-stimulated scaffold protein A [Trichonephila inaurata madagascariensis]